MLQNPICHHQNHCSGCQFLDQGIERQRATKLEQLKTETRAMGMSPEIAALGGPHRQFRDRTDLTIKNQKLGFYDKGREVFSLTTCEIFTPELQQIYSEFSQNLPKVEKGSLRLRHGLNNQKGLWLDFANIDIKNLLDEKIWLNGLLEKKWIVEIGQKRKRLTQQEDKLKLADPQPDFWFSTGPTSEPIPLKSYVSSFTQPSRVWNHILVEELLTQISGPQNWLEIGSGIGNFTVPLLARGDSVTAAEYDAWSIQCLKENSSNFKTLEIIKGDFQKLKTQKEFTAALVDPPRSGLGLLAKELSNSNIPKIFYISCDLDSWTRDMQILSKKYKMQSVKLVDQFPHTPRLEILSRLELT